MNPFIIPGLKPSPPPFHVIPGLASLSEKQHPSNKVEREPIENIFKIVASHFNENTVQPYHCRKRELVKVRRWTIFVAKCVGYLNKEAARFFSKDPSTIQHLVVTTINEITIYTPARQTYLYFQDLFCFSEHLGRVRNSQLKTFLIKENQCTKKSSTKSPIPASRKAS